MIRLQERTAELYSAPQASVGSRLKHFVTWLESEPFFKVTLAGLPDPGTDGMQWITENVHHTGAVSFPEGEADTVACCWLVVRHVSGLDDPGTGIWSIGHNFVRRGGIEDAIRAFLEVFVDPILVWLKERLLVEDHVLHSLDRYSREAAWFRRDGLRHTYEEDTTKGEERLNSDLRHHLFRDGIDFPFSEVRGPSGQPDIVVPDDEAEPLPLEVKVYDPDRGRDDGWVRSGFVQAIEYAHDYRRADGYLAVFDVSHDGLAIAGDDPKTHLPFIRSSGVTVFVVVIPIGPTQAASRRRRARRKTLDSAFFLQT